MKNRILILGFLFIFLGANSQQYEIDFKNPESVLNAVFYAANTKEFVLLQCLGDPLQKSNGQVKQICSLSYIVDLMEESDNNSDLSIFLSEFYAKFEHGKISGQISYENFGGIEYANLTFSNPNSVNVNDTKQIMKLVKRYGNWYLFSF
jgi:hypothetical protein